MLKDKHILLAVTGGIAAYKTPELVRCFVKQGAQVKVIMSDQAQRFVSPLSLSVVSRNEIITDFYTDKGGHSWNNHVHLADWADIMVIAPATLNTLHKCSYGQCDSVLMATYFSFDKDVFICPAMDLEMYRHPSTTRCLDNMSTFPNHYILGPDSGFLASGKEGKGRMVEPHHIVESISSYLRTAAILLNTRVLITAGSTYENIDPVRFIGNYSTGKMGIALALRAAELGAEVNLILGPHRVTPPSHPNIKITHVQSARDMMSACDDGYSQADYLIFTAAVADYRPKVTAKAKIKKGVDTPLESIELVENPDILKTISSQCHADQKVIGFALETEDMLTNAKKKLRAKKLDAIVVNTVSESTGFGVDTNQGLYITSNAHVEIPLVSKTQFAHKLWDEFIQL